MRTKLYKMMNAYANETPYAEIHNKGLDRKQLFAAVKHPSPEYNALRTFMMFTHNVFVLDFIVKNFDEFKEHLPTTCIFLELNSISLDDMKRIVEKWRNVNTLLSGDEARIINEFAFSICKDIDVRKRAYFNDNFFKTVI